MNDKETLEEAAENFFNNTRFRNYKAFFCEGAKWQAERMYSEEEVINALHSLELKNNKDYSKIYKGVEEWFEQFKKK